MNGELLALALVIGAGVMVSVIAGAVVAEVRSWRR